MKYPVKSITVFNVYSKGTRHLPINRFLP